MKYKDLIRTLEIAAKYNGGLDADCFKMWAEHDEHGIELPGKIEPEEVRELAAMGWFLGCDAELDEDDLNKWENASSLSDEELMELFGLYHGVYKYE